MDGQMGWESSLWSNQHNGIEESFVLSNPIQEPYEMVDLHHQIVNSDWEDDLGAQLCVIDGLDEDLAVTNPSLDCNIDTVSVEDDRIFSARYASLWNLDTISNKNKNKNKNYFVTNKEAECEKPESLKRSSPPGRAGPGATQTMRRLGAQD